MNAIPASVASALCALATQGEGREGAGHCHCALTARPGSAHLALRSLSIDLPFRFAIRLACSALSVRMSATAFTRRRHTVHGGGSEDDGLKMGRV